MTSASLRLTLGQLCKRVGLARSSVLHYEALGLLAPASRSAAGYRLYGAAQLERLLTLRRLREAGLTLADIRALLYRDGATPGAPAQAAALLERRLLALGDEADRIRAQQRGLARLLAMADAFSSDSGGRRYDKAAWVALLRRADFDEAAMRAWHVEFERDDPAAHAAFLAALGLAPHEVAEIRHWSAVPAPSSNDADGPR